MKDALIQIHGGLSLIVRGLTPRAGYLIAGLAMAGKGFAALVGIKKFRQSETETVNQVMDCIANNAGFDYSGKPPF